MNYDELKNVAENYGIIVAVDNVASEIGCNGVYVPEDKAIVIDVDCVGNAQVLAHEVVHALDPACQGDVDEKDWKAYAKAEVRAEYGARCVADDVVDDGYLENYASLLELDEVLDEYAAADAIIEKYISN